MFHVYKNSKLVERGNLNLFIGLDDQNNVVLKTSKKIEENRIFNVKIIEVKHDVYSKLITKNICESGFSKFYHKLKDGKNGSSLNDFIQIYNIELLKAERIKEIDEKTESIIYNGILFDGEMFSSSPEAQRNWIGMYTARTVLPYPFLVTTLDDKEYSFTNATSVEIFYLTGMSMINSIISSGRSIKMQINNCNTKEEIDAIVDSRL